MEEIVVNLHMHTRYSDGSGSHRDVARAALRAGLDAVIVTDHNVLVGGLQRYLRLGSRRLLLLVGEEIHDRNRRPQKDHLLALGVDQEMAVLADDTQSLINRIRRAGGLAFIAHLHDPAAPAFKQPDISWLDWSISNYTGIELWNGMSEFKALLFTKSHGVLYAFLPALMPRGPSTAAIQQWDRLLRERRVVAIGGSDAHAFHRQLGILRRTVYPYEYHFRAINTHVLLPDSLVGDPERDARAIYEAIAAGHCFVGYDLPRPTRGFRFAAHGRESGALMGDEIESRGGVTLQAYLPSFAEMRLIQDGRVIQSLKKGQALTYRASEPGTYRIEAYVYHLGRRRGWIFSNPIYVR